MGYAGIDIGNSASCIALAHHDRRDVKLVPDAAGLKEISTVVQYGPKMRAVGFKAGVAHISNLKSTIVNAKRLLGRSRVEVEQEGVPFDVADDPVQPAGTCMINIREQLLAPEQVLASVLKHLKHAAEAEGKLANHAVLAIPCFYGQAERSSMLAAAAVAGLKNVTLMHELTAAAVDWVTSRPEFPKFSSTKKNVAFVDVGHSSTQVRARLVPCGTLGWLTCPHGRIRMLTDRKT